MDNIYRFILREICTNYLTGNLYILLAITQPRAIQWSGKHPSHGNQIISHKSQEKIKKQNKGMLHENTYRQHYLQEVTRGVLISWFPQRSQHSSEPSSNDGTTETCREKQRRGSELVTRRTTIYFFVRPHSTHGGFC